MAAGEQVHIVYGTDATSNAEMLSHYGTHLGIRNARKHIAWYLGHLGFEAATAKAWRRRLCTAEEPDDVRAGLRAAFNSPDPHRSAA